MGADSSLTDRRFREAEFDGARRRTRSS